jgi:YhcH/YjgK/YiaL family protein
MIVDSLALLGRYTPLHPGFGPAQSALQAIRGAPPPAGRYDIDGERLFVLVASDHGRGREVSPLEFHRRYIDIQLVLAGGDEIGWKPLADCRHLRDEYDAVRDIGFYADQPALWLTVPAGCFAIFYPDDTHAPLAVEGPVTKAVAKVAVEW